LRSYGAAGRHGHYDGTGITYINGGTVKLAGIVGLGAASKKWVTLWTFHRRGGGGGAGDGW